MNNVNKLWNVFIFCNKSIAPEMHFEQLLLVAFFHSWCYQSSHADFFTFFISFVIWNTINTALYKCKNDGNILKAIINAEAHFIRTLAYTLYISMLWSNANIVCWYYGLNKVSWVFWKLLLVLERKLSVKRRILRRDKSKTLNIYDLQTWFDRKT